MPLQNVNNIQRKSSTRRNRGNHSGIVEGIFLPFEVVEVEEGPNTMYSSYSTQFTLKQLNTKKVIKTVVFNDYLEDSIESKILDCILPAEVEDYELQDLIGGRFEAILKFNRKNSNTFINLVEVRPLEKEDDNLEEIDEEDEGELIDDYDEMEENFGH